MSHQNMATYFQQAGRALFDQQMDEKMLGGSFVQADILDALVFLSCGDMVFDEKAKAISSPYKEKGNLLAVTPIFLFDPQVPSVPSSSFVSEDGLFVSKKDAWEYLSKRPEDIQQWLFDGAQQSAMMFINAHSPSPDQFSTPSTWRQGSWQEFVPAFPNSVTQLANHFQSAPENTLLRLQSVLNPSSILGRSLKKIAPSVFTDNPPEKSTTKIQNHLAVFSSPQRYLDFTTLLHSSSQKDKDILEEKAFSWAGSLASMGHMAQSFFYKQISSVIEQAKPPPTTLHSLASSFVSNPLCTASMREEIIRSLSAHHNFQKLTFDTKILKTLFALSNNPDVSQAPINNLPNLTSVLEALEHLSHPHNDIFCGNHSSLATLLEELFEQEKGTLSSKKWSTLSQYTLFPLANNSKLSAPPFSLHPIVSALVWHRPVLPSKNHVPVLLDSLYQDLSEEPRKFSSNATMLFGGLLKGANPSVAPFYQAVFDNMVDHLPLIMDNNDLSPQNWCWEALDNLASSCVPLPVFQASLSQEMLNRGFLDIEGLQSSRWRELMAKVNTNPKEDVKMCFQATKNLSQKQDILSSIKDKLKAKAPPQDVTPLPQKKM